MWLRCSVEFPDMSLIPQHHPQVACNPSSTVLVDSLVPQLNVYELCTYKPQPMGQNNSTMGNTLYASDPGSILSTPHSPKSTRNDPLVQRQGCVVSPPTHTHTAPSTTTNVQAP